MPPSFWKGARMPKGEIHFGRLGEENPNHPGTYRFSSTTGLSVPDAHICTPDADTAGNGQNSKPAAGSYCVAVMTTDGAACFILGFCLLPSWDEESDDPPQVGNPDDNATSGDKVWRTSGGASVLLKRGGAVIIEGGPGTGVILQPVNNQLTLRSTNFGHVVDGYNARRGRKEIGKTDPHTSHTEAFLDQVGPSFDRVSISHGDLDDSARRELAVEAVTVVKSDETTVVKIRERYFSDGSWSSAGPKYTWGDGDQAHVLGNALVEALGKLIDIVKNLKVNTAWGPSTPPIVPTPLDLENLKSELSDKILSTYMFLSKNPKTP